MTYRKVGKSNTPYPSWIRQLDGKSGAYVIKEGSRVVYVGESHTGRLRKTLTRHFQAWERSFNIFDISGWSKHTGHVYDRASCSVAVHITTKSGAVGKQNTLIKKLKPRDNQIGAVDEPPF